MMKCKAVLKHLSNLFFKDYSESDCPELMRKPGRPYNCLMINSHSGYYVCIPFRSHINHSNSYMFTSTERSKKTSSGLDFSKIVIISDEKYFATTNAVVDQDEYNEAVANMDKIISKAEKYINGYIEHKKGTKVMHPREYDRKYKFSTLPYFNDVLLLDNQKSIPKPECADKITHDTQFV